MASLKHKPYLIIFCVFSTAWQEDWKYSDLQCETMIIFFGWEITEILFEWILRSKSFLLRLTISQHFVLRRKFYLIERLECSTDSVRVNFFWFHPAGKVLTGTVDIVLMTVPKLSKNVPIIQRRKRYEALQEPEKEPGKCPKCLT